MARRGRGRRYGMAESVMPDGRVDGKSVISLRGVHFVDKGMNEMHCAGA